jgi:hypothetical protein
VSGTLPIKNNDEKIAKTLFAGTKNAPIAKYKKVIYIIFIYFYLSS